MLQMETQSLQAGQMAEVRAEMFYQALNGRLLTRFTLPPGEIMITNHLGELSVYNEAENKVYRTQSLEYSSTNNLLYFFLHGKVLDLGLGSMGFEQEKPVFSDDLMITRWLPPASLRHLFSSVELVHQGHLPIYAAYYDAGGGMVKKVYYSDYYQLPELDLPMTVTEFSYLPGGDSIVSRIRFSDVRINQDAASLWFDFQIPDDARIID